MADRNHKQDEAQAGGIEEIVASAVAQALHAHLPALQAQIVQQVLDVLPRRGADAAPPNGASSKPLVHSVARIHAGTTQKEILRGLSGRRQVSYCSRIALFVVKAGAASGWQSRGFSDDEMR